MGIKILSFLKMWIGFGLILISCSLTESEQESFRTAGIKSVRSSNSAVNLSDAKLQCNTYYDADAYEQPEYFDIIFSLITPEHKTGVNFTPDAVFVVLKNGKLFEEKSSQFFSTPDILAYRLTAAIHSVILFLK